MTHDSDVERVARAIYEAGPQIANFKWHDLTQFTQAVYYAEARAALSAMPHAALMREAMEALEPFESEEALWHDLPEPPDENEPLWIGSYANRFMTDKAKFTLSDLRRARAAADKIRAALTEEKQP